MLRRGALLVLALPALAAGAAAQQPKQPVLVGLDLALSQRTSTSAAAIREGVLIALSEVNDAGGVLGGRPLAVVERDNRSVPARGAENLRELAAIRDLVAVVGDRFGPVYLEQIPVSAELGIPLLAPWSALDAIVDNGRSPNWVFRLSLRDEWVIPALVDHVREKGARRLGVILPNTAWGRGSERDIVAHIGRRGGPALVATRWYNRGETTFAQHCAALRAAGAEALVAVIDEIEGATLVKEIAALPPAARLPIASHWGLAGADFAALAGPALHEVDLVVVQAFGFAEAHGPAAARVASAAQRLFGRDVARFTSAGGLAQAYDLVHILARAIDRAGSTDRAAVRDALEHVEGYRGLVRHFARPFTPSRHEALGPRDLYLARFDERGALVRVKGR